MYMGITQKAYYANMARLYSQSSWFSKSKIVKVKITQSCLTNSLWPHRLYTVQGTLQARILEWVAFPFSRGIFPTQELNPALQADSLPAEPQGKLENTGVGSLSPLQWIFLTQELNWGLLHCRRILYQLSYEGSHDVLLLQIPVLFVIAPNWKQRRRPSVSQQTRYGTFTPLSNTGRGMNSWPLGWISRELYWKSLQIIFQKLTFYMIPLITFLK